MNPTLTVVLPLRNVESTLPSLVAELVEILPELTHKFEVVMVDDGSTDHTIDVAHEQSLLYPQVQLLVHPTKLGAQESLRSALRYSNGEVLVLCRDVAEFDPNELTKLWANLTPEVAVAGRFEQAGPLGAIPRLPAKATQTMQALNAGSLHRTMAAKSADPDAMLPDVLMVPRRLLLGWQQSGDRQGVIAHLQGRGFALPMVALRSRRSRTPSLAAVAAGIRRGLQARPSGATARRAEPIARRLPTTSGERTKIDPPAEMQTRGPSYLMSRLRAFTWGE